MPMKTLCTKLFSVTIALLFVVPLFAQSEKEVMDAAISGYKAYLNMIPEGQTLGYGFNNKSEFDEVTLGKPVLMNTLDQRLLSDNTIQQAITYVKSTGEWRVPLTVKGEYRAFVSVAMMDGKLACVDFGAAALAKEIGKVLAEAPSGNYALLRLYGLNCDLLLNTSSGATAECIPLQSASALMAQSGAQGKNVTLDVLLPVIKSQTQKVIENQH